MRGAAWWAGVGCLSVVLAAAGATQRDVLRVLQERGVGIDTNMAERGMVDGVLRAVDSRARIVDTNAAAASDPAGGETHEEWAGGILYVRLSVLSDRSGEDVVSAVRGWTNADACGVILDARGAGGESFQAVEGIAGLFVEPGTMLYAVKDARGSEESRAARGGSVLRRWPLVVLTDGHTRDAAELLAAVLQKRRGILLMGERTFGDDSRRERLRLGSGETLYVATGHVEVGDRRYRSEGVQPDIAVSGSEPAAAGSGGGQVTNLEVRVSGDSLLRRSADILLGLKAVSPADGGGR